MKAKFLDRPSFVFLPYLVADGSSILPLFGQLPSYITALVKKNNWSRAAGFCSQWFLRLTQNSLANVRQTHASEDFWRWHEKPCAWRAQEVRQTWQKSVVCCVFVEVLPANMQTNRGKCGYISGRPVDLDGFIAWLRFNFILSPVLDMCLSCGFAETYA